MMRRSVSTYSGIGLYPILICFLLLAGCGDSTGPDDPEDDDQTSNSGDQLGPGTGSYFDIEVWLLNESNVPVGINRRVTMTVTSDNESHRGYDNVVTLLSDDRKKLNHLYYEESGDVLFYYPPTSYLSEASTPGNWGRLPFGTKTDIDEVLVDTAYTNSSGLQEEYRVSREVRYGGEKTIMNNGTAHDVQVINERLLLRTWEIDGTDTAVFGNLNVVTYYYDPEMKYFVWIDLWSYMGLTEDAFFKVGSRDVVADYELK